MSSFLFCTDTEGCEAGRGLIKVDFFDGRLYRIPAILSGAQTLISSHNLSDFLEVSSFAEEDVHQALMNVLAEGALEEVIGPHTFGLRFFGPYDELDTRDWAATFENELKRELAPEHPLYSYRNELQAWAKRADNDDVFFCGPYHPLVLVHLTWSKREESPPWPGSTPYASLKEFWEQEMRSEIKDFT